ncbi:MAG: response regulator transcription factor [Ruminococcaceae bacterium]|nr:response regulator transcription factor [Oscillospiraceae bacterium]
MRILVVEDEKRLAEAVGQILTEQKYMVDIVNDGQDGYDYGRCGIYDCIILDIMLPKKNGFEVCSLLRQEKISTPILMLTAKDSINDKVHGLDLGADDYMTKPFSTEELLARIRTLTRRKGEVVLNELRYEDITFSISSCELRCDNSKASVRLSYKESEILKLFLLSPSVIISKEELITKIWGYDSNAGDNNVEAYISFLRKKLSFVSSNVNIVSFKKLGYRLMKNG